MSGLDTFEYFYRFFRPRLISKLNSFRKLPNEIEEIVQETLLAAWLNSVQNYENDGLKAGWLFRVARNKAINLNRRKSKLRSATFSPNRLDTEIYKKMNDLVIEKHQETIDTRKNEALIANLTSTILEREGCGSVRDRIARHFYLDGQDTTAISRELNLNLNTVLSHLKRFRDERKRHMETSR